jgi:hypothetical protein
MIFTIMIACLIALYIWSVYERAKCKHEEFFETRSCSAYCMNCKKKLGFIGDLRKDPLKKEIWLNQPFDKNIK